MRSLRARERRERTASPSGPAGAICEVAARLARHERDRTLTRVEATPKPQDPGELHAYPRRMLSVHQPADGVRALAKRLTGREPSTATALVAAVALASSLRGAVDVPVGLTATSVVLVVHRQRVNPARRPRQRRSHVNDVNPQQRRHVHKPPAHKGVMRQRRAGRVGQREHRVRWTAGAAGSNCDRSARQITRRHRTGKPRWRVLNDPSRSEQRGSWSWARPARVERRATAWRGVVALPAMELQSGVDVSPPPLLDSEAWTSVPERSEGKTGLAAGGDASAALSLQVIARRELVDTRVRWMVRTA